MSVVLLKFDHAHLHANLIVFVPSTEEPSPLNSVIFVALFTNKLLEAFVNVSVCTLVNPVTLLFSVKFTESPDTVDVKFVPPVITSLSPKFTVDSVELSSTIVKAKD